MEIRMGLSMTAVSNSSSSRNEPWKTRGASDAGQASCTYKVDGQAQLQVYYMCTKILPGCSRPAVVVALIHNWPVALTNVLINHETIWICYSNGPRFM